MIRSIKLSVKLIFLSLLCFVTLMLPNQQVSARADMKKVLFISSYSESYDIVSLQLNGIKNILTPAGIGLDIEYMDTKRFDTDENIKLFHDLLKYKLNNCEPYDAVIVGDDRALEFAMDYQNELFNGLPIVFIGINDLNRAQEASYDPHFTGVVETIALKDTISLGLKFNPDAKHVVAFTDDTYTGIGDTEQFAKNKSYFPDISFETVDSSKYTLDELSQKISEFGNDTILLYLGMFTDKNGQYHPIQEFTRLFNQYAKVPVYRVNYGGIGSGILGGKIVSFDKVGEMAADMVLRILNGTSVDDIEMVMESPSYYLLDYKLLKKFNIDPNLAPEGTVFVNKKESFFERNRSILQTMFLLMAALSLVLLIVILDNIKRRSIEKALTESRDRLAQTNEELKSAEEELREQYCIVQENLEKINLLNERFELSTSSTNSAIWELNIHDRTICFSDNVLTIIGNDINLCENIDDFKNKAFEEEARLQLSEEFSRYLHYEKNELNIQVAIRTPDNSTKWIMFRGKGVRSSSGDLTLLHGILIDTTKMKEQDLYIEHLAHNDYLTNLPNRLCFMDRLCEEIKLGRPLAIIMLDIDNFKEINDTLGHVYGDLLLKEISDRLISLHNDKMFISRFGGDEFLILLSDQIDIKNIEKHIHKIQKAFKTPLQVGLREHFINFSMGISRFPVDSDNLHQLIMDADTAMYKVKHNGKSNYCFYDKKMQESLLERASIETLLRRALKEDGFYLVYQPIINVSNGKIEGFEALLRLKNHKIPPNIFIPVAESSDLILEIGRKVTLEVITQIASWKDKGFPPKKVSINFSTKQIKDYSYLDFLRCNLEKYKVDPKYLVIEITETILMDESDHTTNFLYGLRDLGIKIAMDDFGTGYSSINYLTYMPVDQIKLDKSLSDKFLKLDNIKVMNSIISLAHSLNLTITAEGVEEEGQYERLKDGGCDYIQGFYFSRPLEVDQVEDIYNKKYL